MKYILGLFLLAIAFLSPDVAQAAARFLTCNTTCTITAIDTTIWGTVSGGTGASVPGSADDVTLDASTCVGGTTCTATFGAGYNPTWLSLTQSLCTASTAGCILDANTNTNTITLTASSAYTNSGAGTRTLSGGTWILSANGPTWNISGSATITNSPSIQWSGTGGGGTKRFLAGGKTYGTITVSSSTSPFVISAANTFSTFTVSSPNKVIFPGGVTTTITTFTNITGTLAAPSSLWYDSPLNGAATVSSGNNFSCTACGISGMTFSGGGTFSATSSFDQQNNTNITMSPPSGGGGGGGRIIGG